MSTNNLTNAISPAAQGFGVGVYPDANLPEGFSLMTGTTDITSDNYGNYQYGVSVMCWIPKFYYRWGNPTSKLYSIYGANALEIVYAATSGFANTAEANSEGFALHRAFIDGGVEKDGFFIDKYQWSNESNIAVSVKNGQPLSSALNHNPFSGLTGAPSNNIGTAFAVAKTRGADFFPCSIFQFKALAYMSLAHAQACKANNYNAYCAWADLADIGIAKNYPRGNNSRNLGSADVDSGSTLAYTTDGYSTCGLTGSGVPFNLTTHNGQACGVADLNGNMWEITPGITVDNCMYYILKESVAMRTLTGGNTLTTDAWGANGITANYTSVVGATIGAGANGCFGSGTSAIFSSSTAGNEWALASAGVPLVTSVTGVQYMGADYFYCNISNELCPVSGGYWSNGTLAGVWALFLYYTRSHSVNYVGGRSGFYA